MAQTVNASPQGGASLTGMIHDGVLQALRQKLLMPEIMVSLLLAAVSSDSPSASSKSWLS